MEYLYPSRHTACRGAVRVVATLELELRRLERREMPTLSSKAWRAVGPTDAKTERLTPGGITGIDGGEGVVRDLFYSR
jgi:hypothetical protein